MSKADVKAAMKADLPLSVRAPLRARMTIDRVCIWLMRKGHQQAARGIWKFFRMI